MSALARWVYMPGSRLPSGETDFAEGFRPSADWVRLVRQLAANDLKDGGSGRYGVFRDGRSHPLFERWRAGRDYLWTYDAALRAAQRKALA
jgi:hypothetical protein